MRSTALSLLALLLIAAGTAAVLAAPRYQPVAVRPSPSALFTIEQPAPTPSPTPTPTPTPTPAAAPNPPGTVTFPVPVFKQTMNLDCETAALQMGLAALGHTYSQQALFAGLNPDTRQPVMVPGTKRVAQWGNPYTNFVGNVNGSDLGPTGYGVYYPLILAIARSHGAPASTGGENVSATQVYAAVANGHPVVVWVETGWENARAAGYTGTWTSWPNTGSRPIKYSLIEHAVTLSGVSTTQIRVNDPWKSGSQYWFSKAAFEASWADFNNMAVILQ
ncbi:MAG: C39 family peptidase [Candidatus Dormibacter sp.]